MTLTASELKDRERVEGAMGWENSVRRNQRSESEIIAVNGPK